MNKKILYIILCIILTSFASAQLTVTDGLKSCYSFDTDATDDYGSTDGTIDDNGGLTQQATGGILGGFYNWTARDGSNIRFTNPMNNNDNWSIVLWFTSSDNTSFSKMLLAPDSSGANSKMYINAFSDEEVYAYEGGSFGASNTHFPYTANEWHFVVLTFNGTERKLYYNAETPIAQTESLTNSAYFDIGANQAAAGEAHLGGIDELRYYNKTLTSNEVSTIYNGGIARSCFVAASGLNESLEQAAQFLQTGTATINSATYSTVVSGSFNSTQNTTSYFGATLPATGGSQQNTLTCRITIDDVDYGSETMRTISAGASASLIIATNDANITDGQHNASLECKRSGVGSGISISDSVLIGHLLYDEFNQSINNQHLNFTKTFNTASLNLLDNTTITTAALTEDGTHNASIVVNWNAEYGYNADNEVVTMASIGGNNCSLYPRYGTSGSFGSVGGDCILNNAGFNNTYNISFYSSGNGNTTINAHIKSFIIHDDELSAVSLNGTNITSSTLTKLNSLTIDGSNHANNDLFVKVGVPHKSNSGTTTSNFIISLDNGTSNSTDVTRTTTTNNGVTIIEYLFESIGTGTHTISLYGSCANSNCTITGGDLTAYIVNPLTEVSNDFTVTANNTYNNATINNFNVTISNGNVFSTTTGSVTIGANVLSENLTIRSNGYFSQTVLNHPTTSNIQVNLTQAIITFNAFDRVTNTQINNFTVNNSIVSKTTTNGSLLFELIEGNLTFSFINEEGYYNISFVQEVFGLDNKTVNISNVHNHQLQFFAINNITGSQIHNFTINISTSGFNQSLTAVGNNVTFNLSTGANYTSLIDATGLAIVTASHNSLTGINSSYIYNIRTTNSLDITFIDVNTLQLMNGTNITVQFIGDTAQTNNTVTGGLYVDLFSPDEYTIVYSADGYRQGQYILTITNRSAQNLTLYMELENATSLILMTVNDKFGNPLESADITIQRYINNSWITEQIVRTDFQGRTESYFVLSTEYYNFLIDYQGSRYFGIPNNDADKKVIYAEDVNTGLNFFIDITGIGSLVRSVETSLGVNVNLSFVDTSGNLTSGYFRFVYDDPDNTERTACLQVIDGDNNEICSCASTTVTSESSTITCVINQTSGRKHYQGVGLIDGYTVVSFGQVIGFDTRLDWGLTGFFLGFILVVISFFIFINQPSISLIFGTMMFITLSILGVMFKDLSFIVWIVLIVMMTIIANIRSNSGVNG